MAVEGGEEVDELDDEVYADEEGDVMAVSAGEAAAVQGWEELLVEAVEECNGEGGVHANGGVDAGGAMMEHTTKQMAVMRHG